MSYRLERLFDGPPWPVPLRVIVICDKCRAPDSFNLHEDEYPRDPPHRAGWKITDEGAALCPNCK